MRDPVATVHRVTCAIRHPQSARVVEMLAGWGVSPVWIESGRTVRRRRGGRRFGFLGETDRLENSLIDVFQFMADPAISDAVVGQMVKGLEIHLPGRGAIYVQEVREFIGTPGLATVPASSGGATPGLLRELALITCIMSLSGSGEDLARLALELGTGVPMVTLGVGSGVRDQMGLLRITIPPEKEIVRLLVPALDAEGVMRMLIEEGRLNRPGKGFIYSKPVLCGVLDTRLEIGRQEHTASMEQVIAALDDLKKGAAWRRRFPDLDADARFHLQRRCHEIIFICPEEASARHVAAAMRAGAGGATTSQLRRMKTGEGGGGARERSAIIVPQSATDRVLDALLHTKDGGAGAMECLQIQPVPLSFSYRPAMSGRGREAPQAG